MIRHGRALPIGLACKPRASGDDPNKPLRDPVSPAVNPARAGMIPTCSPASSNGPSKPRASGDDPAIVGGQYYNNVVNPARAGMIRFLYESRNSIRCKPRASGDDPRAGRDRRHGPR